MSVLVACGLTREAKIIARDGVVVVVGGGDSARLEHALEAATAGASIVLSCGVAGALDPGLGAGDIVVGLLSSALAVLPRRREPRVSSAVLLDPGLPPTRENKAEDGFTVPVQDPNRRLLNWLIAALPQAHLGTVVGADSIVASVAEKAALYATTGAIAVDMESHVAERVAARHGLPFAIVRTISDSADHALPPAALVGMKPDGGVALGAILRSLARNPAQLPALLRTGRDAGAAFRALSDAIGTLDAAGIGAVAFENDTLDA